MIASETSSRDRDPRRAGSQTYLKRINRAAVLNLLRRHGGLSRARLVELTGLDGKSLTNISAELLKDALIVPTGMTQRRGGRPGEVLDLNPEYGFALGIDLGAAHATGAIVDFQGRIRVRARREIHYGMSSAEVMEQVISIGEELRGLPILRRRRLLGMGLCVPGLIDRAAGVALYAANLRDWRNVPVREILSQRFATDVKIEEATRGLALGEIFGRPRDHLDELMLVDASLGLGVALVVNGQVHDGHGGMAGEIGHTTVVPNGRLCRCGKRGCLSTEASGHAIAARFREAVRAGRKCPWLERSGVALDAVGAKDVAAGAVDGDPLCAEIFSSAVRLLGQAVANAALLFAPRTILLNGGLTRSPEVFFPPFREEFQKGLLTEMVGGLRLEVSQLGDDAGPLGAASLILNPCFNMAQ